MTTILDQRASLVVATRSERTTSAIDNINLLGHPTSTLSLDIIDDLMVGSASVVPSTLTLDNVLHIYNRKNFEQIVVRDPTYRSLHF